MAAVVHSNANGEEEQAWKLKAVTLEAKSGHGTGSKACMQVAGTAW